MNYLWGRITLVFGVFFLVCAFKKSEFIVYRILTAQSRILWGENVHGFYKVVGAALIVVAALFFVGVFGG
jgi:hypothetical protein